MTTASARPALVALICSGCIMGNGVPAKESRSVGDYRVVSTRDAIDIRMSSRLAADELEVRCDDNLIDLLETRVDGNELIVKFPGHGGVAPKATCEVTTGRLDIRGIHTSGSGDITGEGPFFAIADVSSSGSGDIRVRYTEAEVVVDEEDTGDSGGGLVAGGSDGDDPAEGGFVDHSAADASGDGAETGEADDGLVETPDELQDVPRYADRVELRTSGSGDVHLSGLDATRVELRTSGSGDVYVAGLADRIEARSSGSGDVSAKELEAARAELRTSGSGDMRATATASVTARSSGSGDITVWGNPDKRSKNSSGSGDIRFR